MPKHRLLIMTTAADLSLPLLRAPSSAIGIEVSHIMFDDSLSDVLADDSNYDFIYFRDPFNDDSINQKIARSNVADLLARWPSAYSVDTIAGYDDLLIEDKLEQAKIYAELMPESRPFATDLFEAGKEIIKKRISARSKEVYFRSTDLPAQAITSDYLVQPKLNIKREYRVFMIGGRAIEPLAIKSSKTDETKTKVVGLEKHADRQLLEFCQLVYAKKKFDFLGLDVALTDSGCSLLEINRSCQFDAYSRLSGLNLADKLYHYLLDEKLPKG